MTLGRSAKVEVLRRTVVDLGPVIHIYDRVDTISLRKWKRLNQK